MPTAPSKHSAAGVMTLEEVAETLGCTALQTKRLIARRRLRATRLRANASGPHQFGRQPSAEVRVLASEVASYVAAGAEDFESPAFNGSWLVNPESDYADIGRNELANACENQVLDDSEVIARFRRETANQKKGGYLESLSKSYEVRLKATPEVMAASQSARLSAVGIGMKQALGRCKTWLRLLAVVRLRELARQCIPEAQEILQVRAGAIRNANPTIPLDPLDSLYSAPDFYDLVCTLAWSKLKEGGYKAVVFRRSTQMPDALDGSVVVTYSLAFSAIKFEERQLFDIAF